jgi:hypothetical protein
MYGMNDINYSVEQRLLFLEVVSLEYMLKNFMFQHVIVVKLHTIYISFYYTLSNYWNWNHNVSI